MLKNAKKTKIVCTLGPASDSEEVLTQLVENGLNVCRFNFSHGDHAEQKVRMDTAKRVREKLNVPVALLLDTKGPEIRTGKFADPEVLLEQGQQFIVTMDDVLGTKEKCTVSYKELVNDVKVGDTILIDDGLVGLKINEIKGNDIICTVENSGIVKNHKGVNLPGVKINLPALTPKDISDIEMPRSKYLCQNRGIRAGFFKKSIEYPCLHYKSYPCNQRHTQRINQPFRNHRTQRFGKRCTIIFSQHPATGNLTYTGNNQVGGIRHKDGIHTIGCFGMLAQRSQRKLPPPATKNMTKHTKH